MSPVAWCRIKLYTLQRNGKLPRSSILKCRSPPKQLLRSGIQPNPMKLLMLICESRSTMTKTIYKVTNGKTLSTKARQRYIQIGPILSLARTEQCYNCLQAAPNFLRLKASGYECLLLKILPLLTTQMDLSLPASETSRFSLPTKWQIKTSLKTISYYSMSPIALACKYMCTLKPSQMRLVTIILWETCLPRL